MVSLTSVITDAVNTDIHIEIILHIEKKLQSFDRYLNKSCVAYRAVCLFVAHCLQSLDIAPRLCIEMFRMKQRNCRNGGRYVRFRIGRTPIDTIVDMLREDNNGKNVVLHRTHLRNISDQDFKILEEVYQELGTLYNRVKRKHRFDKNADSINIYNCSPLVHVR